MTSILTKFLEAYPKLHIIYGVGYPRSLEDDDIGVCIHQAVNLSVLWDKVYGDESLFSVPRDLSDNNPMLWFDLRSLNDLHWSRCEARRAALVPLAELVLSVTDILPRKAAVERMYVALVSKVIPLQLRLLGAAPEHDVDEYNSVLRTCEEATSLAEAHDALLGLLNLNPRSFLRRDVVLDYEFQCSRLARHRRGESLSEPYSKDYTTRFCPPHLRLTNYNDSHLTTLVEIWTSCIQPGKE